MATNQRSADSVYEEIAELTGNRAELERQRFLFVKAIRSLRSVLQDDPAAHELDPEGVLEIETAIARLEKLKACLWREIEITDANIQGLTDLVQNGAYNA